MATPPPVQPTASIRGPAPTAPSVDPPPGHSAVPAHVLAAAVETVGGAPAAAAAASANAPTVLSALARAQSHVDPDVVADARVDALVLLIQGYVHRVDLLSASLNAIQAELGAVRSTVQGHGVVIGPVPAEPLGFTLIAEVRNVRSFIYPLAIVKRSFMHPQAIVNAPVRTYAIFLRGVCNLYIVAME